MEVAERIRAHSIQLTAAERRVAEAILAAPQAVGFGTVADLAATAGVGAASVVRLATKLGFDGYTDLQACIQLDLTSQLRPAAERILEAGEQATSEHAATEMANVRATLDAASDAATSSVVERLSDLARPVVVLSGEASAGVTHQFLSQLHQLRADVSALAGSEVAVRRDLAVLDGAATVVVIDLRRYERWVLDAHQIVQQRGLWSAGLTDSMLSPIAARADVAFVVAADSVGPFDSHVGTMALLNLFVAGVASRLRDTAPDRLAAVEAAWRERGTLTDTT
ncbi:MAG: MurR/RpiR family transcriptional regulator [Ilumatobacter sp.]|uniref:MurR/RpiR family transcriptional regulator n=1 Tax=Ilumatobacter sp. TaxID=1967498 RepID=UPI0026336B49|nr:MurR/RpiR family transcriptional regulator [Ilumatobacter sp.]MDJ0768728.1 MurR/RpiR family transcriptional regulator [Ilumatobacter sp.]